MGQWVMEGTAAVITGNIAYINVSSLPSTKSKILKIIHEVVMNSDNYQSIGEVLLRAFDETGFFFRSRKCRPNHFRIL